jgi:hypothetical protein
VEQRIAAINSRQTMKRACPTVAVVLLSTCGAAILAAPPFEEAICFPRQPNLCCTCPDDYCAKPLPVAPCPPACSCLDNYCPKPLPKVCFKLFDCIDDYCKKPFPKIFKCCPPPAQSHH